MSLRREMLGKISVRRRSKTFLVPMLEMPLMHISEDKNYLIDVGFTTVGYPQVVLVFDNIDYEPLRTDIYKLQNHYCCVDVEYGDNDKEVIIYLNIPEEFRKDFDKFIEGRYTEFSDKYKELLVRTYGEGRQEGFNSKDGLPNMSMYDVIYPEESVKSRLAESLSTGNHRVNWKDIKEVLDPPNKKYEVFKKAEDLKREYGIE